MENESTNVVQTKEWVLTLFLTAIPIVNIIMLFVWAFGSATPPSKANWAKAALIWAAIGIILYLFVFVVFGVSLAALN